MRPNLSFLTENELIIATFSCMSLCLKEYIEKKKACVFIGSPRNFTRARVCISPTTRSLVHSLFLLSMSSQRQSQRLKMNFIAKKGTWVHFSLVPRRSLLAHTTWREIS